MSDVVVRLPVRPGEEARLFGAYLDRFIQICLNRAERCAADIDAPFVMVRSDPQQDVEMKVLTFQLPSAARAFMSGWAKARTRGTTASA